MRNIEIKVRVPDLTAIVERLSRLGAVYCWTGRQTDTYFRVPNGRLKLRETDLSSAGTLIGYQRADAVASRVSHYRLSIIEDPASARTILDEALGILVTVDKRRDLYLSGQTMIHLDEVEGLGRFVELETVVGEQSLEDACDEHEQVYAALGLVRTKWFRSAIVISCCNVIDAGDAGRRSQLHGHT